MNAFVEIPLAYRLALMFAAGILLGHLANLLAFALSSDPRRSPWSGLHPYDDKSRWLDRLPLVGWFRLSRKSDQLGRAFWVLPLLAELGMGALCAGLYYWEVGLGMLLSGGQVAPGRIPPSPITWEIMHALFGAHVALSFFMLVATLIDFDERVIPDEITVPGTLIGLMLAAGYAWTLMPVDAHIKPPGIQFVEFMTLVYPGRSYPDQWPAWLEAPKQTLPLFVALAVFWFWCLSLLPWLWLPRRGFEKAVRMFVGHAVRSPYFPSMLTIAVCGGAGIVLVWSLGGPGWAALLSALAGLAMGGGLIWSVRLIFAAILGKEAMGFGDVTLLAMIGTYMGWQAPIFIFFVAPCVGLVFGGAQWALGMGREIPYGPFLCLATVAVIIAWRWFWGMFMDYFQPVANMPVSPILMLLSLFVVVGCLFGAVKLAYRSYQHRKSQIA
ncbi:MAG TPA: A24 family peptidase [Pirellulales bacterium]|nr:A24 family peptidase [Pirellulales bacterium]